MSQIFVFKISYPQKSSLDTKAAPTDIRIHFDLYCIMKKVCSTYFVAHQYLCLK